MSTREVADNLVAYCKNGQHLQALEALYSPDIVSSEALDTGDGMPRVTQGIDAVRAKNQAWLDSHEIHEGSVEGPLMHGDDRFACIFDFDVTAKAGPMAGQRMRMHEVAVYTVKGDRITDEQFYYTFG